MSEIAGGEKTVGRGMTLALNCGREGNTLILLSTAVVDSFRRSRTLALYPKEIGRDIKYTTLLHTRN